MEEKILFHIGSHVFVGEEFKSKWRLYWLKPICFSEYFKQFLELWNAMKPFRMWKHFGNPLEMVRICTLWKPALKCRGENILVCVHYPHAGECATALHVINNFFFSEMLFYHMLWYWFIYSFGKIKRYNACITSPKFSSENFAYFLVLTSIGYYLHATLVICMQGNSAYVLSKLILKLSKVFEIMLST